MRLGQSIVQTQTMSMKLAPKMIQAMKVLQLPVMALQEHIEQQLSENPLLEMRDSDPELPDFDEERENPDKPDVAEKELVVDDAHNNAEDFERLDNLNQETPDYFDDGPRVSSNRVQEDSDRRHDAIANIVDRPESLHDYLLHQLGELELPRPLQKMCERIVSTLSAEDGGYFKTPLDDLLPPGFDEEQHALAEEALHIVQSLDPPGIAARDLKECLLLQLTPDMPYHDELERLITHHLEDLRDNRLPAIEKKMGLTIEQIQDAWSQLRKLNPKPASSFVDMYVPNVTPDVSVEQDDDGVYRVKLEDDRIPTLRLNRFYMKRVQNGQATSEERQYIRNKQHAAQWLIDSIEQRRSTLTKVTQAIVDHQTQFLDEGPEFIHPLKMQQIADKVGVHVTTVSRAVDHKWIQTPRGMFPLKRFFVGGTTTEDGEDVAWDTVRIKLQELVDHEDKSKPYSDDELVRRLKEQGFEVARRTITKYRQKMGIASSRQRRDWSKK
ncbi:RNA polymerase factor sigma-54 [Lignipirellula cremea]|uniref:RNA polymerase sigma-54 factor n=1 Tax=Lignipirellula cremea TaxID=2528010 RepID=A0A518E3L6_9BACT|nr:RNA polymerase factor sigma-54 [Lignipirellula cremea]QDU98633.1 RNA polymerase sigma-54 factor [Lignipirellula cremea]